MSITPTTDPDFWKSIVDNAPAMLWCIDQNGIPVYYNRHWLRFAGLSETSDFSDAWLAKLHPDDRDLVLNSTGELLTQRKSIRVEYRLERHDGEYRNVLDLGEPQFDSNGNFVGYIGSTVDITEQRKHSQQLVATNEQLDRSSREIQLLNEFNDHLQVCKGIEETLPILKKYGKQLFPNASVSISLIAESRNIVEPFVSWGNEAAISKMFAPDACWALRRGKTHIESPCEEGSLCPNTLNCKVKFGYMCIPMMAYGEVLGVMNVCFHSEQSTDEHGLLNKQLAQITADQVALAIANLKLRETLQHQSTRDSLTQLYNRRYLFDNLEREFCRAAEDGQQITALMLDVDHFKRFNDTYGHDAGDLILREIGVLLRQMLRSIDLPCRYGGEEFLIVLVDTNLEDGVKKAEEIREAIANLTIEYRKTPLGQVTASIGVAGFPQHSDSVEYLMTRADQALYDAKANGRNAVVTFQNKEKTTKTVSWPNSDEHALERFPIGAEPVIQSPLESNGSSL